MQTVPQKLDGYSQPDSGDGEMEQAGSYCFVCTKHARAPADDDDDDDDVGGGSRGKLELKQCVTCGRNKPQQQYSKRQWSDVADRSSHRRRSPAAGAGVVAPRTCKQCTAAALVARSRQQAKGRRAAPVLLVEPDGHGRGAPAV